MQRNLWEFLPEKHTLNWQHELDEGNVKSVEWKKEQTFQPLAALSEKRLLSEGWYVFWNMLLIVVYVHNSLCL